MRQTIVTEVSRTPAAVASQSSAVHLSHSQGFFNSNNLLQGSHALHMTCLERGTLKIIETWLRNVQGARTAKATRRWLQRRWRLAWRLEASTDGSSNAIYSGSRETKADGKWWQTGQDLGTLANSNQWTPKLWKSFKKTSNNAPIGGSCLSFPKKGNWLTN